MIFKLEIYFENPIIYIYFYEIYIIDPKYIDQIYVSYSMKKTEKWDWSVKMFTTGNTAFSTLSHKLHRQQQLPIASFFSKVAIQHLEPIVQSVVNKLVLRLKALQRSDTFINLVNIFTALIANVIFQYSFDCSANLIEHLDFALNWHKVIKASSINFHVMKHFKWAEYMLRITPVRLIRIINLQVTIFIKIEKMIAPMCHVPFIGANPQSKDLYSQVSRIQQD